MPEPFQCSTLTGGAPKEFVWRICPPPLEGGTSSLFLLGSGCLCDCTPDQKLADAVPSQVKRFFTIASIAEMGGSGVAGPAKEQLGASRQRSSREREPADKGAEPRDPRVAIIQGRIWGPLSKGGHYPRVDHGSTIQGWPLFKGWPLSKGWPCCRHQKRPFNFLQRGS